MLKAIGTIIMGLAIIIPLVILVSGISLTGAILIFIVYGVGAAMFLVGEATE